MAALILALLAALVAAPPASAKKDKDDKLSYREQEKLIEQLPEKYQQWIRDVQYLISPEETKLFLELEKDYLRDAFIETFWKVRDPYPESARNELREDYNARLAMARETFGKYIYDDRTRVLLTNGFPHQRIIINCRSILAPTEVWYYDGSQTVGFEFLLLFYQRWGTGVFRIWDPSLGIEELGQIAGEQISVQSIRDRCTYDESQAIISALSFIRSQGAVGAQSLLARIVRPPEPPQGEWVATFASYTTELPEGAITFDAQVRVNYPGRKQSRTVVQGAVGVEPPAIQPVEVAGGLTRTYNLLLTGEILREDTLFDNFRYQFDFPADGALPDLLPLVFQRYLRPGSYELYLKVEDLGSGAFYRSEQTIDVPLLEKAPPADLDEETAQILREANAAIRDGETTVAISPLFGEWQTGLLRIDAATTGSVDKVTFMLDGKPILTKRKPPFNVELDLGNVPRPRVLRVEAYDEEGVVQASDEVLLNSGDHRFDIRLEEPRPGRTYERSLRAEANVAVPKGDVLERVEFYVNDTKVSTLYQEPWIQPIVLPEEEPIAYVRAVAYTPDGAMAEDLVFVNAPDNLEEIDVEFVELYTLVLDRGGRPVEGLQEADFQVFEDEVQQELVRFELVENLPIHAAIVLDVSASMEGRLGEARDAAVHFFRQAVTPKDRATTIVFNDHPNLTHDFTNDVEALAADLGGVKAERGTALYDALIYSLYYFNGIRGQRAILLLSDGEDESSRFDFD
ncbi:MAG: VWA domain-containing protein, partial [Acidobacteriota bacterium]